MREQTFTFTSVLGQLDDGKVAEELTRQLREVVRACEASKQNGAINLKLTIKPEGRQFIIDSKITPTVPAVKPELSMFFADEDGSLRKDDPKQVPLRHVDVKPSGPLRSVSPGAGVGEGGF
jgi:hypothetical protein